MSPRSRFTSAQLYRDVTDKLAERYQGGRNQSYMIIIDEATTLRASAINMLRNLHDDPACRPAIILADTVSRLDGFLYSRAGIAGGNEQLRSRAKAQFIRDADARFGWTVDARGREVRDLTDIKLVADATLGQLGFDAKLNWRYPGDVEAFLVSNHMSCGQHTSVDDCPVYWLTRTLDAMLAMIKRTPLLTG